jgi:hypothetical protein
VMSLSDHDLTLIGERFDLFITQADVDALRPEDLLALLDEVRILRRQHAHDVKMLTRCREQLGKVADDYREVLAHLEAIKAQDDAEADPGALEAHAETEVP